ncbi:hypothetical protein GCM10008905_30950 [Clostridium malenominatum]|uniref:DUF2752 domain-containing protein n=1 Tax=Clostridium malenominatum TaxID=1539 RepID=A0ABN1J6B8_9CLOT
MMYLAAKTYKIVIFFLPFILIPAITPFYLILDKFLLVKIFGCGCVGNGEIFNSYGGTFNANDLRTVAFGILVVLMIILATYLSLSFNLKSYRMLYIGTVSLFNVAYWFLIIKTFFWK